MSWRGKRDPWADIDRDAWLKACDDIIAQGGDAFTALTSTDPRNDGEA